MMDHYSQRTTTDRTLRLITILGWFLAFALCVPHGVVAGQLFPALAVLPMTFSACTGIFHLAARARSRELGIAMDLFCACFIIGMLIPWWLNLTRDVRLTVLATYGTVPMIVNL